MYRFHESALKLRECPDGCVVYIDTFLCGRVRFSASPGYPSTDDLRPGPAHSAPRRGYPPQHPAGAYWLAMIPDNALMKFRAD